MTRIILDRELELLNRELTLMGKLCADGIDKAVESILCAEKRQELKEEIHTIERETDRKERDIENLCMKIILRQQPIAGDLRFVAAAMHMIGDMERIGDQIVDIADISCNTEGKIDNGNTHIKEMGCSVKTMVDASVRAFVKRDTGLADEIICEDDKIDRLFADLKYELIEVLRSSPEKSEVVLDVLMIGKYFERIADHAVNVSENLIKAVN